MHKAELVYCLRAELDDGAGLVVAETLTMKVFSAHAICKYLRNFIKIHFCHSLPNVVSVCSGVTYCACVLLHACLCVCLVCECV